MSAIFNFIRNSIEELTQKVSWPSQEKVQELGYYFIIAIVIATTIVGILNIGLDKLMQWVYTHFK